MKISAPLNNIFTKSAILGAVMLAVNLATMYLVSKATFGLMVLAGLVSLSSYVLYGFLVYRFTKGYAQSLFKFRSDLTYFTYLNGFSYIVTISMLAGVVTSLGSYFYLHHVVGYEEYINCYINIIRDAQGVAELPDSINSLYENIIKSLQDIPAPGFLSSIYGGVTSGCVLGLVIGSIVAIFTRCKPEASETKK